MIELVLKSKIPLIHVTTTDTFSVGKILKFYSHAHAVPIWDGEAASLEKHNIYYVIGDPWKGSKSTPAVTEAPPESTKNLFEQNFCVLVIVNADKVHDLVFDVGELPTIHQNALRS